MAFASLPRSVPFPSDPAILPAILPAIRLPARAHTCSAAHSLAHSRALFLLCAHTRTLAGANGAVVLALDRQGRGDHTSARHPRCRPRDGRTSNPVPSPRITGVQPSDAKRGDSRLCYPRRAHHHRWATRTTALPPVPLRELLLPLLCCCLAQPSCLASHMPSGVSCSHARRLSHPHFL